MSDAELLALASLINAGSAEMIGANEGRKNRGEAPCYESHPFNKEMEKLFHELQRRNVL